MSLIRSIGARKDDTRGTTALEVRKDLAGLLTGAGVLPGSSSPLVQGTAAFEYQVNTARWVTSRGVSDGVHLWGNDGAITVATGVAPGSGLSRIDIIYVLHPSNSENGDTDSVPVLGVAQGTAAASPVAPSIPTGALELARNTMTSAATSTASAGNTITQSAAVASLVGGTRERTAQGRRNSSQTVPSGTWTTVWWEADSRALGPVSTTSLDVAGLWAAAAGVFTVEKAGLYQVEAHVGWAATASGLLAARIVAGTAPAPGDTGASVKAEVTQAAGSVAGQSVSLCKTVGLAVGQKVLVAARQTSGADKAILGDGSIGYTTLSLTYLGSGAA